MSLNAPDLRGTYELVLLSFKGTWARGRVGRNDVSSEVWPRLTRTVLKVRGPPGDRRAHPAPFPEELARRCIVLSTWPDEVVFDPFCGSGTTAPVAKELGRVGVGCDLSAAYCEMSRARCGQEVLRLMT